jgi:carboxyl-terminal processing protease
MRKLPMRLGLVAFAAFAAGSAFDPLSSVVAQAASSDTFRQLKLFGDVFERVRAEYVEEVSDQKLIESAINGMLSALDPHSGYLDTDRYRDMQVQTRGEFGGLGIEVTMENGLVKVVSPIDDTPAYKAGVESGDLITHIDNEPVMGLSLGEAVEKMRGPVDTKIGLRLLRKGRDEPFDVTLSRAVIKISPVRSRAEGDIAYVRLTTFNEQTTSEMRERIEQIRAKIGREKFLGLVLDLRNNPGGLLDQAVAVADAFVDKGEIVSTRGRRTETIQRFNARPGDVLENKPMVVLINGGSASASEIVAGALQDHRRAIVMGTPSFGKGSVQTIMPISGGGAIRLTTARYYTPAGTSIQAKGITPDIEVHQANVEFTDDTSGRREADLRGRLRNETEQQQRGGSSSVAPVQPVPQPEAAVPPGTAPSATPAADGSDPGTVDGRDYQLSRALDLLRGIALYEGRGAPAPAAAANNRG